MEYKEFELNISKESPNIYRTSVIDNDSAAAEHTFELHTAELRILEKLKEIEECAVKDKKKFTEHIEFGKELYNRVFSGKTGEYFKKCLKETQNNGMGLRISLRLDKTAQDISALPWEFLHDGENFLVTGRTTLLSRMPAGIKKVKSSTLASVLHMLVVVSNPDDPTIQALNTELEQEVIIEAVDKLQREQKIEVDFAEDASLETIESYLNEKDYHIVHFTGHGTVIDGRGYLVLEKENGNARMVDTNTISELLADRGVRLMVLSACQSGKSSNREAYADLASILIKNRIPAVVAMQYSILDLSATKFAGKFYEALALGKPVDLALTEARIIMKNSERSNGIDFATPLLYLSDPNCITIGEIKPAQAENFTRPNMLGEVQIMKKGFVGRRKELRLLQKDFMSDVKRAAIIHGFGGIGKTVLATRLGLRMNQHFNGMFGMRCRKTTKPEDILNELNAFLNLAGINQLNQILYSPAPLNVKTATLVSILNQKGFLIIFDNFEDCLNEARTDIENPELRDFIRHLLNNTIENTKYIITTRYDFDPLMGRLTGSIEHISLPELPFPEAMWVMNNHKELNELEIEKKQSIFKKLGGHPWTIGQFSILAGKVTVDGLLQELTPLKQEVIRFTLLDKSYSKLDDKTKALLLHASVYQEALPYEALSWIVGDETEVSPPIVDQVSKLIEWGLMAKQDDGGQTVYVMHTLVRDFVQQELEKERLDKKKLLIRAAQYYELLFKTSKNLWDILKARRYYFQAEEWDKADTIVLSTLEYILRWGYIKYAINLLNESIKTTSGTRKAGETVNLASIFQRMGDWKTALNLYNEVKEILEKEGDKKDFASMLHNIGAIHRHQGNFQEAINKYQQSMKISEELGDKEGIARTLRELGIIHLLQGKYPEAINKYQQSMKISEELGDKIAIAWTLHELGILDQEMGNYPKAINKYQQSMIIKEDLGDKQGIATTLHQLGNIHYLQGNYSEAINKYQQSMKISEELGDKHTIVATLYQLGTIHQRQGNYPDAINRYQQSMKISKELGDKNGIATTLHQLGRIHEEKDKDYPAALENYLIAFAIFRELNSPDAEMAENDLAGLKETMGDEAFKKAVEDIKRKHGA